MKTYPIISSNFRYVRLFIAKSGKGREDRMIFSIIFTVLELSYLEADGFNLENKKNGMQFRPPRATQFQF